MYEENVDDEKSFAVKLTVRNIQLVFYFNINNANFPFSQTKKKFQTKKFSSFYIGE